jgi:hypothetical protein
MPEAVFIKLGACIVALELISTACFTNRSHQSLRRAATVICGDVSLV